MKMDRYPVSHKRRKHQRWLNKYCRMVNKIIENDPLWRGRFYITQLKSYIEWFEDGSGGLIHAKIKMKDKKTGITAEKWYDGLDMLWSFWHDFNSFVIETVKVWEESPSPYEDKTDYRKVAR